MRQLITRIEERLHTRLKDRARLEGRSVNKLVTDLLSKGLGPSAPNERTQVKARLKAMGLLVVPPQPDRVPSWEEIDRLTRGLGRAASEALERDRAGE